MKAFLINPARVVIGLRAQNREADVDALVTRFYSEFGARLANATRSSAEVYINLEATCVCRLLAAARDRGFDAQPQSHVDATIRLGGDGDLTRLMDALRRIDCVISVRASDDGASVGILAAGRLRERDLRRAVEDAGFRFEGIEGN
jgi:hypothetical protein